MKNTLLFLLLVAIALPSLAILAAVSSLKPHMVLLTLSINIVALTLMLFNIQSIGLNVWAICLIFILINNVYLALFQWIFINNYFNSQFKDFWGKSFQHYIKVIYIWPMYVLKFSLNIISNKLIFLINRLNNKSYEYFKIDPLNLLNKEFDDAAKCLIFTFENNKLLDHQNLFRALFTGLMLQPEFLNKGQKIIIVSISNEDKTFYIHKNIIIDENTSVFNYIEKIKNNIRVFYESGYPLHIFNILQVKFWELDRVKLNSGGKTNSIHKSRRSFHSSCLVNTPRVNVIKPLKTPQIINKKLIATMDIETIEFNGIQYPISLSFSYYLNNKIVTIFELIDYNLFLNNPEPAIKILWHNFMLKLCALNLNNCVIFSHNLGSFDGYFIFKGLLELPDVDIDNVQSIIDDLHRFISIQVKWNNCKFIFKDSLRIFPVSLQEMCDLFGVEGKIQPYNQLFNNISIFQDKNLLKQFIEYANQDSICLLEALTKAQSIYIEQHEVDIASVWSTSTLSLKIFRQNFLKSDIPILSNKLDNIIRLGYIGGSTDYYYKYGENLKHYDVNSLYPKAMCNPMPIEFLGEVDGFKVKLEEVFGFAEAKITAPDNIDIPLLPYKFESETIHPLGSWIGIYFTEELKTIEKFGYEVKLIKVFNFSKQNIFDGYIKHFFDIKKKAVGPLRFIAKMHLNQLYGYFGRKKTLIETKNVFKHELYKYYGTHTIFAEIDINQEIATILMSSNLDYDLINAIKEKTGFPLVSSFRQVKSHIGIAAAVTSYARIEMMELKMLLIKLGIKLYYTDTDSVFVDRELPDYLIGTALGQLKDELNGGWIKKAYFLGIKKYGYIDQNDEIHSIFSGVERNSLTWQEIEDVANGFIVIKDSGVKFFKSFNNLNISIKNNLKTSIIFKTRKNLIGNWYKPIKINIKFLIKIHYYLKIVLNRILKIINNNEFK